MKIEGGVKSVGTAVAGKKPEAAEQARPKSDSVEPTRVDISSLSARLQVANAGLGEETAVDTARVNEIKQAIAEGRFSINPERIADGLLQSVRDMLKQGR